MRLTRFIFVSFTVLTIAQALSAMTVVVRPDAQMVALAPAIVSGSALDSYTQRARGGGIETVTVFSVSEVIKGSVGGTISIHEAGGVYDNEAQFFPGLPRFEVGGQYLLFLSRGRDGEWHVLDAVLGKFRFETDKLGRSILARDFDVTVVMGAPNAAPESVRAAAPFLDYLRTAAHGGPARIESYFLPASPAIVSSQSAPQLIRQTNATFTAESYSADEGGGVGARWTSFPQTWHSIGSEPGAQANSGGVAGSTAITTAMTGWNTVAGAAINYVYAGDDASNSTESPCATTADGKNTIAFEQDLSCQSISAFTCTSNSYSGVLGLGGVSRAVSGSGGTTCSTTPDGSAFYCTQDGDVWMNRGIANCTFLLTTHAGDWNSAVMHELGHSLGFRHADQNRTGGTCGTDMIAEECSSSAIMTGFVTSNLNATAAAWDQHAATLIYPGSTSFVRGDFNGDGHPDLVWRNYSSGAVNVWFMNGTTYLGGQSLFSVTDTNWHIEGVGDFNGDGKSDLVWRNYSTGQVNVWFMNGTTYLGGQGLFTVSDLNWHIEAINDFNGDGHDDLVWRNYSTGAVNVWYMNGTTYLGGATLFTVADPNWHIVGAGDFNGDTHPDLVWRNQSTGAVNVWFLNGVTYLGGASLFTVADPNWEINAVGDYNNDGKPDLVWRNYSTGAVNVWFMNNTTYLGGTTLFTVTDPTWRIQGPR